MASKMEKITSKAKIEFIIKSMSSEKSKVSLWQEKLGDTRKTFLSRILRFDSDRGEIFLTSNKESFDFDILNEVYFFWEKEHIVFKADISFMSDYKIAVKIPEVIMTKEKRILERIDCSQIPTSINFDLGDKLESSFNRLPFSSFLFDYSAKGLALKVNKLNISKFLKGDRLTMKVPLIGNEVITGKIAHISSSYDGVYRIGVSFE